MSLAEMLDGQTAVLDGYDPALSAAWRRRFEDLGLLPDTAVRRVSRAPLGDPIAFEVRGTLLCLRKTEARLVRVRRKAA
ncbi:MAG: ferrous iron transport protein A [Elusimicrobia bacterium]|nr:ferrous iron transport protein A [Elusimicrobiota bacterium]